MTDIIDRLKEPEAHYPGNFDTPKRANAMLSCMCQEAIEEIESLRRQLAEKDAEIERLYKVIDANWISQKQIIVSQLLVEQLREATECLLHLCEIIGAPEGAVLDKARYALATPTDTTALQSLIAKAGEVMRERCWQAAQPDDSYQDEWFNAKADSCARIRALPSVTLEDLQ